MSSFDRQAILDCLSRLVTPGIKLTALADELGVRKHDYAALRSDVLELVEEGTVHVLPGGAFALAPHGRTHVDPHGKPVPPPPTEARERPSRKHKRAEAPPKRARKPELPWKKGAAPKSPPPKPTGHVQPAEEYDPETGEMRPVAGGGKFVVTADPTVPVKPAPRGAPVTTRREDDTRPIG